MVQLGALLTPMEVQGSGLKTEEPVNVADL